MHVYMPWGKFKGTPVVALDDSYLWWLLGRDSLFGELAEAVKNESAKRWPDKFRIERICVGNADKCFPQSRYDLQRDTVKQVYRELAGIYHPDRGGNIEAMKAVNEFKERLLKSLD